MNSNCCTMLVQSWFSAVAATRQEQRSTVKVEREMCFQHGVLCHNTQANESH